MGNITVWSQFTHSHINIYESYLHCCRSVKWLNRYVLLLFYMCWQSSDEKITHNLWLRRKNYVYCGGIMVTSVWGLYFTLMLLLLFVYWNPVMRKQLINSDFIVKITFTMEVLWWLLSEDFVVYFDAVVDVFKFGDDKKYVLRRFNIYVVNVGSWDFCPRI